MPDTLSLDNRFSNVVGNLSHKRGDNLNFNYNYSIDQILKKLIIMKLVWITLILILILTLIICRKKNLKITIY